MAERYDLDDLLAEIKEDEEMEAGRRKPKASQADIQKMIRERRKKAGKDAE